MPASGCNCPLCRMLRNAISHHVNPATPTSATSVAEFNSSLVVNTSGVSSPLREGSLMFMVLLISCALLGPDQSPPCANPAPNADLATYQSMQAKAGRDPAAHIRMALWCEQHGLNAEKMKHLALAVLKDPQNTLARGLMGLLPERRQVGDAGGGQCQARGPTSLLTARLAEYNRRRDRAPGFRDQHDAGRRHRAEVAGRSTIPRRKSPPRTPSSASGASSTGSSPKRPRTSHRRSSSTPTATRPGNTSGTSSTTAAG